MTSIRRAAGRSGDQAADGPRILKKYPNRRLYDTLTSAYITLSDVKRMVLANESFEVRDAKTGEELTRSILLQIILEEESDGVPMFSSRMLAQIIRFYGHAMQGVMGSYLEKNLQTLAEAQTRFAEQGLGLVTQGQFTPEAWTQLLGGSAPVVQNLMGSYVEQSKKLFETLQEQMQKQGEALLQGMPGLPGFTPPKPDKPGKR